MTLGTIAKENINFYAPRFEVEIEGKELPVNISREIIEVTVNEKINEGTSFELTLHDEFDTSTQKFKWLDDSCFYVGNKVTIRMGYGSNLYTLMMGKITSLEPSFFASETPTLKVGGQDLSYDYMKRATPERVFKEKTYSDIARKIAQEAGLLSMVDDTDKLEKPINKNNNETYYEFLSKIKEEVGFDFDIKGKTMYFVRPTDDKKEILTLELGKDIISFRPIMNTTGLLAEVEVRGHNSQDPKTPFVGKATVESEAESELRNILKKITDYKDLSKKVITEVPVDSKEHAEVIAKSELNRANSTLFGGKVECIGLPQIRTGVNIALDKVGKWFSRKYYVTETTHTINESGYRTQFSVGHYTSILDGLGYKNDTVGKCNGAVCGIVTNNKDAEKGGKLEVEFPSRSNDGKAIQKVRMTTLMAGKDSGSFFLPEVGDEVLVAFENGNTNCPYIIGSLWNGNAKPPEKNEDGKNSIRKIKSRSGHEFIFNDEEQKEKIEIHTKAGHRIILDDTNGKEKVEISDQSGDNSILIDSAQNSMTLSSKTKLSIKAQTIEIEAGGMMTIKSSATLTIKGNLVQIN